VSIASGAVASAFVRPGSAAVTVAAPARARRLVPVDVALENVTRTTVGLRPYRDAGFVLRAAALGAKTIVHNYGHGGGGMSLSWGCAIIASELALQTEKRRAAVLGSGVIGLSTARVLQDRGFDVTIYARDVPPDTTSNKSGAQWSPTSVFSSSDVTDAFRAQYRRAAELAYARYQTLLGDAYGVRWIENYDCRDELARAFLENPALTPIRHLYPAVQQLGPGEHPFPTRYATRFLTMLIEPNRYLRRLQDDYLERGGRLVVREFRTAAEVSALDEPLIVNCTGLGAGALFGDPGLEPVRGQLSVLAPQPAVDYVTLTPRGYMFPRSDGIVLGGTFEHGATSLVPDDATVSRIVSAHRAFFSAMRAQ
jgi:glycine/D-amino acid oxidase-like deaminating enzyme